MIIMGLTDIGTGNAQTLGKPDQGARLPKVALCFVHHANKSKTIFLQSSTNIMKCVQIHEVLCIAMAFDSFFRLLRILGQVLQRVSGRTGHLGL